MFTGFQLHTTETIESGKDELKRFSDLMKVRYFESLLNLIHPHY